LLSTPSGTENMDCFLVPVRRGEGLGEGLIERLRASRWLGHVRA
jgi:hypothetical protein